MKKRKTSWALVLLTSLMVLGACGSGGQDPTDSSGGNVSGGASSDPNVLVVASGADPVTLDIHQTNDQATTRVARQIYETLIKQTNDLELVPGLATEWEEIEENLYEFKLREDVVFHNGEAMTASDVAYTLRRAVDSPSISHIIGSIDPDTIEVIDDHTILIGTNGAFGPFLTHLAHPAVGILSEKAVEEAGEDYGISSVVGTGPFEFVEWATGSHVTLDRFDDHWDEPAGMERIEFRTITDSSVRLIELESGTVDIVYDIAPSDNEKVEENDELTLLATENLGTEYLGFNVRNDTPLQEVGVRRAIAHAIDVESIIQTVHMGIGTQMSGPINELVFGYNENLETTPYDVELAKELLAEAGYPDGGFSLSLYVGDNNQERIRVSQVVSAALEELGITVEVNQMEWGAFLDAAAAGEPDMFLLGWTTITTDADYGLYPLFHSTSFGEAGNRTFYHNERVDELLDAARSTSDQEERLAYYHEAQEIINDEMPWVYLQTRENVSGIRNWVQGFEHHPTGSYFLDTVSKN